MYIESLDTFHWKIDLLQWQIQRREEEIRRSGSQVPSGVEVRARVGGESARVPVKRLCGHRNDCIYSSWAKARNRSLAVIRWQLYDHQKPMRRRQQYCMPPQSAACAAELHASRQEIYQLHRQSTTIRKFNICTRYSNLNAAALR